MRINLFNKFLVIICLIVIGNECFSQDKNQNGYVKFTYPNGKISSEGHMVNGKPDGFWKTYYVTGIVKSEGTRKNFLLDSVWIFYNELSDTLEKISYVLGKRNGYYYQYSSVEEKNQPRRNIVISKELFVNDKREGLSYYYYPNGKLREVINYRNNKKHGIGKEFNNDSVIITLYEYFNDYMIDKQNINRIVKSRKEGVWKEFYNDGSVKSEKNFNENQLTGHLKEFDPKGNVTLSELYDNGKLIKSGKEDTLDIEERITKDANGKIIKRSYFRKNVPTGIQREYDGDGNVINAYVYNEKGIIVSQGIVRDDGTREGKWNYFYEDGQVKSVGNYINNRQEGEWNFFFQGGKTEQTGKFSKGMLNGEWKWFYHNGKIIRVENFSDGKREGKYLELNISGDTVVLGNYLNGEKDSLWITKFGEVKEIGNYKKDLKEGIWKTYFLDGVLYYIGNYFEGNADGRHVYYYETGKIREEQYYANGFKEKAWKKYNPDGTILLTINYENDMETRINGIKIEKKKTH